MSKRKFLKRIVVATLICGAWGSAYAETPDAPLFTDVITGDMEATYSAENEPRSKTTHEFKDTWFELGIGGTYNLNEDTYLYGNLERSFGGDIETDWRADIGIRWTF